MSRDIRSFFAVTSKKPGGIAPAAKKRAIIVDSSDEDVITDSPTPQKKDNKNKKRKLSDSKEKKKPKEVLKPIRTTDLFGSAPAKQSDVKKVGKKDDDFEKTLQQLDEEFPIDMDVLDKTIDEAMKEETKKRANGDDKKTPRKQSTDKTPAKKRKVSDELNDSGMDPDEERHEKKRHSMIMYQKYLKRGGPAHKGEKELPKGKSDCLKNLCFLKTGVLDSMDRDDFDALIKEHGGRTVCAVSKKVNYLVVGEDAGPAKLDKARTIGIKEMNEDELLDLILTRSGLPAKYVEKQKSQETEKEKKIKTPEKQKPTKEIKLKTPKISPSSSKRDKPNLKKLSSIKTEIATPKRETVKKEHPKLSHSQDLAPIERPKIVIDSCNKSWTEKYKPNDIKSIIGQQGDKSNMKKLIFWLQNWHKNHSGKDRPKLVKPSPWAKSDDGAYFKCALLSGSPGVGKTTTATLVAKELGFDVVEFNASDTRSKRLLHEEVSQLLSSTSIASYFKDGSAPTKKHVLLMDEVDGMAGNEDRGGMQELIVLIKNSNVPIICMCNDRQHPKIRSLVNYCMDLRFVKPRPEQIKGAMMSICFKEGLKISPDALTEIIKGAGMDIRQILNNLSMWTSADKNLTTAVAEKESKMAKKDTVLGPWEVIRQVFSQEDHKNMSIADRSKLFFYDYSIGPLFVQENYLQVVPHCDKKDVLERVAATADSISMGDVIDRKIRSTNNWSLLESQAMYSSVIPGHYMEGHFGGQINFPGWLGKNSKRTKFSRLLSELQAHTRTSTSGSKLSLNLDYIYHLRNKIVRPLVNEGTAGVEEALEVMRAYKLLREDFDSVLELSQWPKQRDPMAMVESKVKAAFTRAYNKEGPALPYAITANAVKKKAATATSQEEELYDDEEAVESDNNDDDDITKDAMIKEKKKAPAKGKKDAATTSKKSSTAKTKAKKAK